MIRWTRERVQLKVGEDLDGPADDLRFGAGFVGRRQGLGVGWEGEGDEVEVVYEAKVVSEGWDAWGGQGCGIVSGIDIISGLGV